MKAAGLISMMMVAAALLAACGGGSDPLPELNPALGGTWTGNTVVSVRGFPSSSFPGQLQVAVAGQTATVSGVCPDGSGAVAATGSGNAAAWAGTLACPPVAIPQCPAVVATLRSVNGSLGADGVTLTALAAGSAAGCGTAFNVGLTFTGTK